MAKRQIIRFTKRQVDTFCLAGRVSCTCEENLPLPHCSSLCCGYEKVCSPSTDASTIGPTCCGGSGASTNGLCSLGPNACRDLVLSNCFSAAAGLELMWTRMERNQRADSGGGGWCSSSTESSSGQGQKVSTPRPFQNPYHGVSGLGNRATGSGLEA